MEGKFARLKKNHYIRLITCSLFTISYILAKFLFTDEYLTSSEVNLYFIIQCVN